MNKNIFYNLLVGFSLLFTLSVFAQSDNDVDLTVNTNTGTPWPTGYTATIKLTDSRGKKVISWKGDFSLPSYETISSRSSFWGADVKKLSTKNGVSIYEVDNSKTDANIAPGASVQFGGNIKTIKKETMPPGITLFNFEGMVPGPPIPGPGFPKRIFAPYVDATSSTFSLQNSYKQTKPIHQKYYTLAFITASTANPNQPAWGGYPSMLVSSYYYANQITDIRKDGGDVIVSFGGADGTSLAAAISGEKILFHQNQLNFLVAAYKEVIKNYKLTFIDFDVEGGQLGNHKAIQLRNEALQEIQADRKLHNKSPIKISYTLPILPSGLTKNGLYVLKNAKKQGVKVAIVNAMTMDFGRAVAPPSLPMSILG